MTTMTVDTPTIVLVHGAWADATGFGGVIRALRERGLAAIGVANPLRDLPGDAAYLADLLLSISGPVVLVGHSYGGAVISNAATGNEQVQALVYLNGLMPDEGETIQQLIESELSEGSLVPTAIRPVPLENPDAGDGVDLYLDRDAFKEAFAADVDDETAFVMAATQRPWGRCRAGHALGPAGLEVDPVVVPARHGGPRHPGCGPAIHGRARERADRGGRGVARVHGLAA